MLPAMPPGPTFVLRAALGAARRAGGALLATALVAAVLGAPVPGAGAMAARAQASEYVPWSAYLPGWTDEYVPTSANDCVAGRPSCLRASLRELNRVLERTGRSCSHNSVFALSYLRMTQSYGWSRNIDGYYDDVPFANHQDAVFAKYYTDAYTNWERGRRGAVPRAWLTAFDTARDKRVNGYGDLLLGMNAHINRDLPFVLAAVGLVAPDGSSRKPDYDRVEDFLYRATGPLLAELSARFDPTVDDLSEPTGAVQLVVFQLITLWRESAWRNAEALVTAPTPAARARVATRIENQAQSTARALLTAQLYLPPLTSTKARDRFCARNDDARAPVAYPFGSPSPYGY